MDAILEKALGASFIAGYSENIGNAVQNPSSGKEKSSSDAYPNEGFCSENPWVHSAEKIIFPIPDDAPPIPNRFSNITVDGKKVTLTNQWKYLDARSRTLAHVLRFDLDDGKKEFRPLTLWQTAKGVEWKTKAPPVPRPLYGLDRLAGKPGAVVIICEGEKSADAATCLFPDCASVASMNGSQSPRKSDWLPLAGRLVYLWPDNDIAGTDYITAVKHLATEAGALVQQTIRIEWFRQMSGEVGTLCDELPKGWDAADALANGFTAEKIQALLDREKDCQGTNTLFCSTPIQQAGMEKPLFGNARQSIESSEKNEKYPINSIKLLAESDFEVIEFREGFRNGVYWREPFVEDAEPKAPLWICSPLIVVAEARDSGQSEWGRLLVWKDNDKHTHIWACPVELLAASDTSEFRRELMRNGLTIATSGKARQKLVDYVLTFKPQSADRVRCVTKTGWHGNRYVLSNHVFGKTEGEGVIYQGATNGDFSSTGDLCDWQREIAARAQGNSRMIFAISCAFAGPLVEMANESGGGFQFTGETSKGKTSTLIDPAASVWGHPDRFAKKWRTTTNGLEALCLSRNDSTLILDDLGQANAKECGQAAYLIANGQGKLRMQKEGGNRPLSTWKTFLLSSGEIDLSQHMAEAGNVPKGGQVARLPSIPADAGAGMYVLENLHDQTDGRQFADTMKAVSRQFYGSAGTAFMEKLTCPDTLAETAKTIRDGITEIVESMRLPEGSAPEIGRVAARFALVAFAGELATRLGVTGWAIGDVIKATMRCISDWLSESGGAMGADEKALFAQVSSMLQAHGSSRFPPHDISPELLAHVHNRAGFSYHNGDTIHYWAESGSFTQELCKGFNPKSAAKTLVKAKWIVSGSDRIQQKKRISALGNKGRWFYVFTPAAVGAEE